MTSPVWHPFTQHGLEEPIPQIERAEGAVLYTADGRRIIDAISSWWVTTHGHSHPRIAAAIAEQAGKLDQLIFAGWTHEPAETLARDLIAMMPRTPSQAPLAHVFFSDSGSTSVEVALKMALGFWANRGEPRHRILVMEHSYHGDTIGAMSVGARGVFNRTYAPLLFDVGTIPFPAADREQAALDALEAACRAGDAAAFIAEPLILGAGGMLVYRPEALREMRAICARHGVLFIADEVMTGWGRTGTLLACEQAGIMPDLLCLAKGLTGGSLPLAVTLASPAVFDAHWSADPARQFFHSSSYTANPIACAAANANLAIWREEPVLDRIAALAARQSELLAGLAALPRVIGARQLGTIIALDVEDRHAGYLSAVGPRLRASFRDSGVLLRPLGNTVYVMPPYCIGEADLAQVARAISDAVEGRTMDDLQDIVEDIAAEMSLAAERGKVADYIPDLAAVSPKHFGIAIVEPGGACHAAGEADATFSVQSITKVFSLTLALGAVGDALWKRVGREPSGSAFNSIVQLETERGIPRNPFINAGAIVVSDVLLAHYQPREAIAEFLRFMRALAGDDSIAIDHDVARGEQETGYRNMALASYMRAFGNVHHPIEHTLGVYFHQCALAASCRQLAMAGRFLMCDGRNPETGRSVVSAQRARRILALMLSCGHYDGSGEFAYRVGLPGKSGVGGGILAIAPGIASIAVWSPGLNERGNSQLGTLALERLVQRTGWSVFEPLARSGDRADAGQVAGLAGR